MTSFISSLLKSGLGRIPNQPYAEVTVSFQSKILVRLTASSFSFPLESRTAVSCADESSMSFWSVASSLTVLWVGQWWKRELLGMCEQTIFPGPHAAAEGQFVQGMWGLVMKSGSWRLCPVKWHVFAVLPHAFDKHSQLRQLWHLKEPLSHLENTKLWKNAVSCGKNRNTPIGAARTV